MSRITTFIMTLLVCFSMHSQTKRALLVGISNYSQEGTDAWADIHGTNDVYLVDATLRKQGYKTKVLTNKSATAKGIRNQMKALSFSCKLGDIIYIHFSCHGQPVEDIDGDEEDGWDESIVPYDALKKPVPGVYEGKNHIIDDELNVFIGEIREKVGMNGFVYVVIDACHSGGMDRGEEDDDDEVFLRGTDSGFSLSNKRYIPRMDTRSNIPVKPVEGWADVCMLEACRAYQSNYEIKQDGAYYGPLSYYVNQTLQQQPLTKDTKWVESVKQLMDRNPKLAKQNIVIQTTRQ